MTPLGPLRESSAQEDLARVPKPVVLLGRGGSAWDGRALAHQASGPLRGEPTSCGSNASRSPSPSRLNAITDPKTSAPGNRDTHQADRKYSRPSATRFPHDAVGGWTPKPRYERPASVRMP